MFDLINNTFAYVINIYLKATAPFLLDELFPFIPGGVALDARIQINADSTNSPLSLRKSRQRLMYRENSVILMICDWRKCTYRNK